MGHDIKTAAETETPTLMMTPISNYTTDNKNALKQNHRNKFSRLSTPLALSRGILLRPRSEGSTVLGLGLYLHSKPNMSFEKVA